MIYLPRRGRLAAQFLIVAGRHTGERPKVRSGAGACSRATYAAQVLRVIPRNRAQSAAVHQSVGSSAVVGVGVIAHNGTRGRAATGGSVPGASSIRTAPPLPNSTTPRAAMVDQSNEDDLQRQQANADSEDDHRDRSRHPRHEPPLPSCHDGEPRRATKGGSIDADQSRAGDGPLVDQARTSGGHWLWRSVAVRDRRSRTH